MASRPQNDDATRLPCAVMRTAENTIPIGTSWVSRRKSGGRYGDFRYGVEGGAAREAFLAGLAAAPCSDQRQRTWIVPQWKLRHVTIACRGPEQNLPPPIPPLSHLAH